MRPPIKPPFGQPCNNCGECCKDQLCVLGQHLFGHFDGPCDALEDRPDSDGFMCGVANNPRAYAPVRTSINGTIKMRNAALQLIGAGIFCDGTLVGEDADQEAVNKLNSFRGNNIISLIKAYKIWGLE